jgi:shikimate dehydrogenase
VTRTAAVLGWPIEHSRSPVIMNAAFAATGIDATMIPIGVPPEQFAAKVRELRALPMLGASVTIPHKLAAHHLCDELDSAAIATGAVNCLALEGAHLVGHNTDVAGFIDGLREAGCEPRDARVVLIGAGGAARAVAYGLNNEHAHVEVFARTSPVWTPARPLAELAPAFAAADLLVDCTPAGLDADAEAQLVATLPLDALSRRAWVATLVYHRRTILLERASERGHSTLDGRAMLIHQGARAFTIWTGSPAPVEVMARALDDSLAQSVHGPASRQP